MIKLFFILFLFSFSMMFSQNIRKNYLEMSPTEITDYRAALNLVWAGGTSAVGKGTYFATIHANHFGTNIHSARGDGSNFTSFHRFMLLHYEMMLKTSSTTYNYLCLPYWDWRNDPPKTTALPVSATNNPRFWLFNFIPLTAIPGWGVTRSPSLSDISILPTTASYNTAMANPTFWSATSSAFSSNLESSNHNMPHVWVSGNMGTGTSPRDPIFFIHHCMVDKIWQEYEDKAVGVQSTYPTPNYQIPSYNLEEGWIDNLKAQDCVDSRKIPFRYLSTQTTSNYEVWYAENGSLILDGANNVNFSVIGTGKLYRYTAYDWTTSSIKGKIYIGDYKRDASGNVVADNKGGFVVTSGNSCDVRAGSEIILGPNTTLTASTGKNITLKIISTPSGF